jgi:mono/diheme cytochrome c family protein
VNCTFCHGPDATPGGGDGGGPNLLRSSAMLDDQNGELIAPIVQKGRGAMSAIPLSSDQISDIAAFLHSIPVSSRTGPSTISILVGDAKKGEAYVAQACAKCHTTAALRTYAGKLDDPKTLQQMWLMPGSGGRGVGPISSPIPRPPITALVTMPSGERGRGPRRAHRRLHGHAAYWPVASSARSKRSAHDPRVSSFASPLQPHKELLPIYTDTDIPQRGPRIWPR